MENCPFCQLIQNPDQLILVGETDNFYAWLEVSPRAKGHTMVVPKDHTENLMELEPSEYKECMKLVREVMEKAIEGLGAEGVSVAMNVMEAGGQMLPHAYIIIFPRFSDDESSGTPAGAAFPHREDLQGEQKLREISDQMTSVQVEFETEVKEPHPDSQKFKEDSKKNKEIEDENEDSGDDGTRTMKRGHSIQWE